MLTWALVHLIIKMKADHAGFHLVIAMGCDVSIFYWIAQALIHH